MGAAAEMSWGSGAAGPGPSRGRGGSSRHPPEEDGGILGTLANGAGCGPGAASSSFGECPGACTRRSTERSGKIIGWGSRV